MKIPTVIAGPILRKIASQRIVFWMALSRSCQVEILLSPEGGTSQTYNLGMKSPDIHRLQAGEKLHYHLIDLTLDTELPQDVPIFYRILLDGEDITQNCPHLLYEEQKSLSFQIPSQVGSVLHGSCRKPHHASSDGLVEADRLIADLFKNPDNKQQELPEWPSFLLMAGDQIYADDVAGPMLKAIHDVIEILGLYPEEFEMLDHDGISCSDELYPNKNNYYHRLELLPAMKIESGLTDVFLGGIRKPIFTTDTADNHLITLAEHLVMYLMVWSPVPWSLIQHQLPDSLTPQERKRYREEQRVLEDFVSGLPSVHRLFAHLPTAMIFDDHDVSDDWNLNRVWEEAVYNHPFSRRIVGNALMSYFLSQGWGNDPDKFDDKMLHNLEAAIHDPDSALHDAFVEDILKFEGWEFIWETSPPLVVLDTRTRRWRSESSVVKPAGLMDWEAITELQQVLKDREAVIMASATPVFGVKLIEAIQRFFTWIGKPLLVDAENWMAHPGTANAILNVFMHKKTPKNFVILSGDVHYSFVYDVELRRNKEGPDIWQICSSGFRNEFPRKLLTVLDIANRWLYAPGSPLNWLTKRRRLRVVPRRPDGMENGRRLLNGAGVGLVELDNKGRPTRIRQLLSGNESIGFHRMEEHSQYR